MPPFVSKEHAATLARALNRRRFGFSGLAIEVWRLFFAEKASRSNRDAGPHGTDQRPPPA
jgi:hypothetical protein